MTRPYAEVIGDPIAHSKSPLIHNFWLGKLGIDAEYRACHVRSDELADYFTRKREDADWRGCNVTMPHKQAVQVAVDAVDDDARRIGAINTIVHSHDVGRAGGLVGFNTDAAGFIEPLVPLLGDERDRFAYVMGSGGAARAIIDALFEAEFLIFSISRDRDKARREFLAYLGDDEDFLLEFDDLHAGDLRPADPDVFSVWVNATPLGMSGQPPLPMVWGPVFENSVIYDIVTNPAQTPLLLEANLRGLRTIDGLAMLIGQAAVAFEKFFGQPAPREHDGELRALLTA